MEGPSRATAVSPSGMRVAGVGDLVAVRRPVPAADRRRDDRHPDRGAGRARRLRRHSRSAPSPPPTTPASSSARGSRSSQLGNVGHIRVYAALASVLAATIVAAGLKADPYVWMALRFVAGRLLRRPVRRRRVVAQRARHRTRSEAGSCRGTTSRRSSPTASVSSGSPGSIRGDHRIRDLVDPDLAGRRPGGAVGGRRPAGGRRAGADDAARAVPPRADRRCSRACMVGVTHGAFIGLGAVYATRLGLSLTEIGLFVSIPTLGVILMSVPISAASDDIDRRARRRAGGADRGRRRHRAVLLRARHVAGPAVRDRDRRHHLPAVLDRRRLRQRLAAARPDHRRRRPAGPAVRRRAP